MRRSLPFFAVLVASVGSSCSVTKAPPPPPANELAIALPTLSIGPGDTFECVYTGKFTDKDLAVHNITGQQAKGGHHITVYWTTSQKTGHAPCTDAEMTSWNMIGGADTNNSGEPLIKLPDGIAYQIPAGSQIVAQVHYINPSSTTYQATDKVTLELMDASQVQEYANLFTLIDEGFTIAPNAPTTSVTTAVIPQDVPLFWIGGHMHEFGSHFRLETIDDTGNTLSVLYDQDWLPEYSSHPPHQTFDKATPLILKQGTKIRQTCSWNNTTPDAMQFPREMCVTVGFYFPGTQPIIVPTQ